MFQLLNVPDLAEDMACERRARVPEEDTSAPAASVSR